ncbi:hypothetical protein MOO45_01970 [Bombilactobacillus folatiphilus]|uniref:PTS EIIA type-4 domain-containing protein n=1 Tax=Bombilactobacillus folatiphilus TaxID=2923362 RepID=A0ABY4P9S2_9LACO|nr:hypothetical protein [Bombilactobacillus folatiphilus]UQS82475.1 hypothetical protein MOO45_01970 [Bombilactobacillus folatiphilus]
MFQAISLIMGSQKHLHYLTAYVDDQLNFSDQLAQKVQPILQQQLIFVSDVVGGSVNNELMTFTQGRSNCLLISGMNLPFLLELVNYVNTTNCQTVAQSVTNVQKLIKLGQQGLQLVQLDSTATPAEEDF